MASTGYNSVTSFKKVKSTPEEKKSDHKRVDEAVKEMWETRISEEISKINERMDRLCEENRNANQSMLSEIKRIREKENEVEFNDFQYDLKMDLDIIKKSIGVNENRLCIYTCIINGYDELTDVSGIDDADFICFTDNMLIEPNGWTLRKIPSTLLKYPSAKYQRFIKMLPHIFLPKRYTESLYIDGNIQIVTPDLVKNFRRDYPFDIENYIYINKHPQRTCLYEEAEACKKQNKDDPIVIDSQVARYKKEKFPKNFGLFENNILYRKHTNESCIELMTMWANELRDGSKRDQLSLTYCQWKLGAKISVLHENLRDLSAESNFHIIPHSLIDGVTIGMCNYNTRAVTNACVKSILKNSSLDCEIWILDNSDKERFVLDDDIPDRRRVKVLDNTNGNIIDFNAVIKKFGGKIDDSISSGYANLRHSYGIQYMIDLCQTKYFLLFDNDTILKKNIDFVDDKYITIAGYQNAYTVKNKIRRRGRFLPFMQLFNKDMLRSYKIRFFDSKKIMNGRDENAREYDTGAAFTELVFNNGLPVKILDVPEYIEHLGGGSWAKVHDEKAFLEKNKSYYL